MRKSDYKGLLASVEDSKLVVRINARPRWVWENEISILLDFKKVTDQERLNELYKRYQARCTLKNRFMVNNFMAGGWGYKRTMQGARKRTADELRKLRRWSK